MKHLRFIGLAAMAVLAAGCSGWGAKSNEYKGAAARAAQPLEVPPELTQPALDDRYAIPDPHNVTSYSAYSQKGPPAQGAPAAAAASAPAVLPKLEDVRIDRAGDQRWLVVKGEPDKVWPAVREFWVDAGFQLLRESPEVGIMETDWKETRDKIPQDAFRNLVSKFWEGAFTYPRRDKFRTRLEKGQQPGTTEVFVSNRNIAEVYSSSTQDRTSWEQRPADKESEAEMLSRMALKISGGDTTKVASTAPVAGAGRPAAAAGPAASPAPPTINNAVLQNNGAGPLVVNDSFDRAWRRVGLALDRVGFTVEDRDRSKGVFFVRYIDPDADLSSTLQTSWVDKLMFWKSPPKTAQPQYRIYVADAGANMSQVQVQDSKGGPETSSTGKKILGLIYEQLK
ncbi:MAG TPA: outer membrane protein assembly factor BamC [Usitatibacter sp.]|nr:outer membrane protein assembly factor BamC [Usitatibacter sp.]